MSEQAIDSEQIEEAKSIAIEELISLNDEYGYYSYNTEEQQKLEKLLEATVKFGFSIANDTMDEQTRRVPVEPLVIRRAD